MKVMLYVSAISFACKKTLEKIDNERASRDQKMLALFQRRTSGFWIWRKEVECTTEEADFQARKEFPFAYPSKIFDEQRIDTEILYGIAKHSLARVMIPVSGRYLRAIALQLTPSNENESERI